MQQHIRVEIKEGSMAHKALLELKQHSKFSSSTMTHIVNVAITTLQNETTKLTNGEHHHEKQRLVEVSS
jgi:hypothetical protein